MKTRFLFCMVLLLVLTKLSWSEGNAQINDFSHYVNYSEGPQVNSVDNSVMPIEASSIESKEREDKESDKDEGSRVILQGISSKWNVCHIDSDCTAVVADCVSWDSINKKYLRKIIKNLNSCSDVIDPGFQPETICAHKACKMTDKTTLVSWEEWLSQMQKLNHKF